MSSKTNTTAPWNKGKLVGQKLPLQLKEIWAIRVRLQLAENSRDLALFNLAIDSKLRGIEIGARWISTINHTRGVRKVSMFDQRVCMIDALKDASLQSRTESQQVEG